MMDHDFMPLYGLKAIAGRAFSGESTNEYKNVLINESSYRLMGFKKPEDALNDQIFFWGDTFRIVGVVKNYHQESLKKAYEPLIFRYNEAPGGLYSIKFNPNRVKESLVKFEETWKAVFPGNPFIHYFLDDRYNQQYQADQQFGKVFGIFSSLAIFIACLGLFGLSSLTAIQRTKEIGVRKVLGASVTGILTLVSKDYIVLMLIAIVLSVPAAWWIMDAWLADFAYRIPLTWWIFAIPSLVVIAYRTSHGKHSHIKSGTYKPCAIFEIRITARSIAGPGGMVSPLRHAIVRMPPDWIFPAMSDCCHFFDMLFINVESKSGTFRYFDKPIIKFENRLVREIIEQVAALIIVYP